MVTDSIIVSVVVPTRNRVEWLRRCLNGIAEQTYPDYEVIIVDDGSTTDVVTSYEKMLLEFGPRFRLVRANVDEHRRLGPSVVRNIGIDHADGTYIAFCDDDDYWCQPDLLAVAATALESTNADLHFSNQKILRGDEVVAPATLPHIEAKLLEEQRLDGLPVYRISRAQMLSFPDYAHLNITIARKSLLDSIGGFWEETRYAEDVDLFVRLCSASESILFRPDVCSVHNSPVQHDKESASKSVMEIDRRLLENSVYWHLLASCKTPEAIQYASLSLSSNSKQLANDLKGAQSAASVRVISRMALAAKPSLKWGVYCLWLSVRGFFSK
jgi:glycosyltransferase involved in cell wall biosynthesis